MELCSHCKIVDGLSLEILQGFFKLNCSIYSKLIRLACKLRAKITPLAMENLSKIYLIIEWIAIASMLAMLKNF